MSSSDGEEATDYCKDEQIDATVKRLLITATEAISGEIETPTIDMNEIVDSGLQTAEMMKQIGSVFVGKMSSSDGEEATDYCNDEQIDATVKRLLITATEAVSGEIETPTIDMNEIVDSGLQTAEMMKQIGSVFVGKMSSSDGEEATDYCNDEQIDATVKRLLITATEAVSGEIETPTIDMNEIVDSGLQTAEMMKQIGSVFVGKMSSNDGEEATDYCNDEQIDATVKRLLITATEAISGEIETPTIDMNEIVDSGLQTAEMMKQIGSVFVGKMSSNDGEEATDYCNDEQIDATVKRLLITATEAISGEIETPTIDMNEIVDSGLQIAEMMKQIGSVFVGKMSSSDGEEATDYCNDEQIDATVKRLLITATEAVSGEIETPTIDMKEIVDSGLQTAEMMKQIGSVFVGKMSSNDGEEATDYCNDEQIDATVKRLLITATEAVSGEIDTPIIIMKEIVDSGLQTAEMMKQIGSVFVGKMSSNDGEEATDYCNDEQIDATVKRILITATEAVSGEIDTPISDMTKIEDSGLQTAEMMKQIRLLVEDEELKEALQKLVESLVDEEPNELIEKLKSEQRQLLKLMKALEVYLKEGKSSETSEGDEGDGKIHASSFTDPYEGLTFESTLSELLQATDEEENLFLNEAAPHISIVEALSYPIQTTIRSIKSIDKQLNK